MESLVVGVLTQIDGDGVEGFAAMGEGVGPVGRDVGYAVEEPPPHAQHMSFAVKSSSENQSQLVGSVVNEPQGQLLEAVAPSSVFTQIDGDGVEGFAVLG